jgi:hypothetical protein
VVKNAHDKKEDLPDTDKNKSDGALKRIYSPLHKIAIALAQIIIKEKLEGTIKESLDEIISYIQSEEMREQQKSCEAKITAEESDLRKGINSDVTKLFNALSEQLIGIQNTSSEVLKSAGKLLENTESVTASTKDLTIKMGKITDTADKIATDTTSYRDAVLSRPVQPNRSVADPKVLGDMERKAKQILIEIYDTEGNNTLGKSLSELLAKANEVIGEIEDADKPKEAKVEAIFKTRRGALVLILNSKDTAFWIKQPGIEETFTKAFSEGSHISERKYNLIIPRVPITFNPKDEGHLRELEEANSLLKYEILKVKWIKPIERRRSGQTHAFAIMTLSSVDSANRIIRDGLYIFNLQVRPTKQKHEPIQCMKCRKWGHFANKCQADKDTCGTCGNLHRTNVCTNKGKVYCVTCKDSSHASWDRTCPEFSH